ncbi:MAG: C40 family peptidase [Catenulispora sp.]
MDCHRPGHHASARCASVLLAVGVLLAPAASDRLGTSQERPIQLAGTAYSAYSTPLSDPTLPQAWTTPPGATHGKARKSRPPAKYRKARASGRAGHGWKAWHPKTRHAKLSHAKLTHSKLAHSKLAHVKKANPPKTSGPPPRLPTASNAKAAQAVREALSLLGIPYRWGGTTRAGFDCSGFTQHVWAAAGVKIPRTVGQQVKAGAPIPLNRAQPGDLVAFYPTRHHVGIYIGNGLVVDAPHTGSWVRTDPIRSMPVSIVVRPYM